MAIETVQLDPAAPEIVSKGSPTIAAGHTFASVTDKISSVVQSKTPRWWFIGFGVAFTLVMVFLYAVTLLIARGVGIWGINVPVAWGFAIVNFVWWIGIGHAGTLISAILLLLRQEWRTSINRFAEAMTLFAVACAGMFPLLHLGRIWKFYYLFPYPNTMGLYPQWRSPLVWDVFAVSTYATVSLLFWYVGLIPDLGTMRDRASNRIARILFGVFALGWRGSARHWRRYDSTYMMLAALATPLVISVHSVVGMDFAAAQIPGWHTTFFPPYFVAGAIYSGFAMVLTLAIPLRWAFGLQDFVTMKHLENMAKVMLACGMIVAYSYIMEAFTAWYSDNIYEWFTETNRLMGPYRHAYWTLIACNIVIPQLLWFKWVRTNIPMLFLLALVVNTGMWLERYIIVITSLHRDFIPSSWGMYSPTIWDWATFIGTMGLFAALFFLFVRFLPIISMSEMRQVVAETSGQHIPTSSTEIDVV